MSVDVQVDARQIRVRSALDPPSALSWSTTLLQDRRISWKGSVQRGELDRRVTNLAGSEIITVRMNDGQGTICTAAVTVPA